MNLFWLYASMIAMGVSGGLMGAIAFLITYAAGPDSTFPVFVWVVVAGFWLAFGFKAWTLMFDFNTEDEIRKRFDIV